MLLGVHAAMRLIEQRGNELDQEQARANAFVEKIVEVKRLVQRPGRGHAEVVDQERPAIWPRLAAQPTRLEGRLAGELPSISTSGRSGTSANRSCSCFHLSCSTRVRLYCQSSFIHANKASWPRTYQKGIHHDTARAVCIIRRGRANRDPLFAVRRPLSVKDNNG